MKTNENTQKIYNSNSLFSFFIAITGNSIEERGATSLSELLKSNTTLTVLYLSCEDKERRRTKDIHQQFTLFISPLLSSTDNDIGDTGVTSLSEALKLNTTLTELNLSGKDKRKKTQKTSINTSLFSFLCTTTDNNIGERGATSLSEVLKSNTTLTQLYLGGEDKRKNTHKRNPSAIDSFLFLFTTTGNHIGDTGAASFSEALKSNTTLTKLDLSGEDERKTHKKTSINNSLFFLSLHIDRQQYRRHRSNIIE